MEKIQRTALKSGTHIKEYIVRNLVGLGGSSLCYEVFHENTKRKFILKEINPLNAKNIQTFYHLQKREQDISTELRQPMGEDNPYIMYAQTIEHEGISYLLLDTEGGSVLSDIMKNRQCGIILGLAKLADILEIALGILSALEPIHKANYLHGDIAPDNLYVSILTHGDKLCNSIIRCIDFNSSFKLSQKEDRVISSKIGYTPLELRSNSKLSKISFGSDLYSVTAIIFQMLYDEKCSLELLERQELCSPYFENETAEVVKMVRDFLRLGIKSRFSNIDHMKCEIGKIKEIMANKNRIRDNFHYENLLTVGRQGEIEQIQKDFEKCKTVALWGIGGIGKTHIAQEFALRNREKYRIICYIDFDESLFKTLNNDQSLTITNFTKENFAKTFKGSLEDFEKDYFKAKMEKLYSIADRQTLLIINGFDTEKDESMGDFIRLNCDKLITTRWDFQGDKNIIYREVLPLNMADSRNLFLKHYTVSKEKVDMETLDKILKIINCHTLAIELIGKSALASDMDLEEYLDNLQQIGQNKYPKERIDFNMDREYVENIFKKIFDISKFNGEEKYVLGNLCLVSYKGIDRKFFRKLIDIESADSINQLAKASWIFWNKQRQSVELHNVISDVCIKNLCPDEDFCHNLLTNGLNYINNIVNVKENHGDIRENIEILAYICQRVKNPGEKTFKLALAIAENCNRFAMYSLGEKMGIFACNLGNKIYEQESENIAKADNCLGHIFGSLGNHKNALKYKSKALEIRKNIDTKPSILAQSYDDTGYTFGKMGNFQKALEYKKKALEIREQSDDIDIKDIAKSYNNIGITYMDMENYPQALEYQKKSFDIRKKQKPIDLKTLSFCYDSMCLSYSKMGFALPAALCGVRSLNIRKEIYEENDSVIARAYGTLGHMFFNMGIQNIAKEYYKIALKIAKETLPDDNPFVISLTERIN